MRTAAAFIVINSALALGCGTLSGADEFAVGTGGAAASTTASSAGNGGNGGVAGMGGTGGSVATAMVERGLLVRYFLDDGDAPMVADSAPDPLNLTVTATQGMMLGGPQGRSALSWPGEGLDDRASAPVDGSKIDQLRGLTTGTIEVVLDVDAVVPEGARFIHIGFDNENGRFTLSSSDGVSVEFYWRLNRLAATWPLPLAAENRMVLHMVLDTSQAAVGDRARLYLNGDLVAQEMGNVNVSPPQLDQPIDLAANTHFVLGNREIGGRSIHGSLHYGAYYTSALSRDELRQNVARLLDNDDR